MEGGLGPRVIISVELSTAMTDFLEAFQEASVKWLLHDVPNGARVGVTSFDAVGAEEQPLTTIDDTSRQELSQTIQDLPTPSGPGDCVGGGLEKSLQVMTEFTGGGQGEPERLLSTPCGEQ